MQKTIKKINIFKFVAILFVVFTVSFSVSHVQAQTCGNDECVRNVEISCSASDSNINTNDSVTWTATAQYGTGYYTYSWSGTNSLYGNSSSVSKSYSSAGTKTARVAVTSGGRTFYQDCGSVYVTAPQDEVLTGSCSVSDSNINIGDSVLWSSDVSGGNGTYTYSWSGTNSLYGSNSSVSKSYTTTGTKTGSVTIRSGNQSITRTCGSVSVDRDEDQNLTGSCSVSDSNVSTNDYVEWSADASGGTGSYTYSWSGSSPLSGRSGSDVSVRYSSTGTKTGRVTIRSGNQSVTYTCGDVYVEDYDNNYNGGDFNVSCNVNNTNVGIGQNVIWNAYVTGGNGNYRYSWSGTDGVYGSNSSVSKSFNTTGTKIATVTVTSNGRTRSLTCPTVVVGGIGYANQGNVAGLTSVYLNQVPYTGVEDNPKFWAFIIGLFMFSALGAYIIVSKKAKVERINKILDFKNENMAKRGIK